MVACETQTPGDEPDGLILEVIFDRRNTSFCQLTVLSRDFTIAL
jgi:hypothetical protein